MATLRLSSLLFLAAVGFQALGCSGDPGSSFDVDSAPLEALDDDDPDQTIIQTPPVKVMISDQSDNRLIGMVATHTAIGSYAAQTEYWNAQTGLSLDGALQLQSIPLGLNDTENDLSDWLSPLAPSFQTPRIVKLADWQRGIATMPAGLEERLFWTEHPDNSKDVLAVLLVTELNPQYGLLGSPVGELVAAAWYRTTAPTADGLAFKNPTFLSRLEPVLDRDGKPSTDPNDILVADWHHVVMPMR